MVPRKSNGVAPIDSILRKFGHHNEAFNYIEEQKQGSYSDKSRSQDSDVRYRKAFLYVYI